jgi:hypothetical protein
MQTRGRVGSIDGKIEGRLSRCPIALVGLRNFGAIAAKLAVAERGLFNVVNA